MIHIIQHWCYSLVRKKNHIYVSKVCPICQHQSKSYCFRLNLKLKVFKCYACGVSGKSAIAFIKRLKEKRTNKTVLIEVTRSLPF